MLYYTWYYNVVSCNNISDTYTYSHMYDIDSANESDFSRDYLMDLYKEIAVVCKVAENEGIEVTDADLEQTRNELLDDGMFEDEDELNMALEEGTFNLFYYSLREKVCIFLANANS